MNVEPAKVCVLVLLLQAIILKRKGLPSSQLNTKIYAWWELERIFGRCKHENTHEKTRGLGDDRCVHD